MKRTYTLIALLGLVVGSLMVGCSPSEQPAAAPAAASTNAPAAPAADATSTNK